MIVEAVFAGLSTVALTTFVLAVRDLRQQLALERARTADLLNRLSARSYESYAALQPDFVAATAAPAIPRRMYDETGLIEIDLPDSDE